MPSKLHDIFVSYAWVDNQVVPGAKNGWVTTFMDGLKANLAKKLGRTDMYDVWMDLELRGNEPITDGVFEALNKSSCILIFLSPAYLESEWCCKELSAFVEDTDSLENIFIVEITECQKPKNLSDLRGYQLWRKDAKGLPRTYASPIPDPQREPEYFQLLDDLSRDIASRIKLLSSNSSTEKPISDGKYNATIFLAETTSDLKEQRNQVLRFLEQNQFKVLPKKNYTFLEKQAAVVRDLKDSQLFVQLLSEDPGDQYPQFQFEKAQETNLPLLLWHSRNLTIKGVEKQHKKLLESEFVITSDLTTFQNEIVNKVNLLLSPTPEPPDIDVIVFVNHCPDDEGLATEIKEMLDKEGVGYSLPMRNANSSAAEVRKNLEENLTFCDALVIPFDKAPSNWLHEQLMQCLRIRSKRDTPIKVISVCAKNLPLKDDIRIKLPKMQLLKYPDLEDFFQALYHE